MLDATKLIIRRIADMAQDWSDIAGPASPTMARISRLAEQALEQEREFERAQKDALRQAEAS